MASDRIQEVLIVYGSLAPGEINHHIINHIKGTWSKGFIRGQKEILTDGEAKGYFAFTPDDNGSKIEVAIFISKDLHKYWDDLDEFEGEDYLRTIIDYEDIYGEKKSGYIYAKNNAIAK